MGTKSRLSLTYIPMKRTILLPYQYYCLDCNGRLAQCRDLRVQRPIHVRLERVGSAGAADQPGQAGRVLLGRGETADGVLYYAGFTFHSYLVVIN